MAEVLEGVEGLASSLSKSRPKPLRWDQGMIHARCCLDHLAGRLGAQLANATMAKGFISHSSSGPDLTDNGAAWLASLSIDLGTLRAEPRKFLRFCPDWIEDSAHIGGAVGAAMLSGLVDHGWLRPVQSSRKVLVTPTRKPSHLPSNLDGCLDQSPTWVTGSAAESRLYGAAKSIGLNDFVPQYRISGLRPDFANIRHKVAIEVDGPHHDQPHYAEIDRRRDYVLNRLGWTVYRFSADQAFNQPYDLARTIKNILEAKDNTMGGGIDPFV